MGQINNIVIADGANTPVSHTFTPITRDRNLAIYKDKAPGITVAYPTIEMADRWQKEVDGSYKISWKLSVPTLATTAPTTSTGIQPAPTVGYTCWATGTFTVPNQASLQDKKNIYALAKNFIALTLMKDIVESQDFPT